MDFKQLAERLLGEARGLLPQWLPAGKWRGHEFQLGNLAGEPGTSLSINANTGQWSDFAAGHKGGDLVSLYAAIHGLSQGEAAKELAGDDWGKRQPVQAPARERPEPLPPPRNVVMPAPSEITLAETRHFRYGVPTTLWTYRDAQGETLGYVARYDPPGERKQIVPFTYAEPDGWGMGQWPDPRPLYGLDYLAAASATCPVMLVEGEKAAEAARSIAGPRYVVLTWPGGAQAWRKVDWKPIAGRHVLMWPDADWPGMECMVGIGALLETHGCTVKVIDVAGQPANWDAADSGYNWDQLLAWAKPRAFTLAAIRELPWHEHGKPPPAAAKAPPERAAPPAATPTPPKPARAPKPAKAKAAEPEGLYPWEGRPWAAKLIVSDKGIPKPMLANAITALAMDPDWKDALAYDVFAMRATAVRELPIACPRGAWSDVHDILTADWLQRFGINIGKLVAGQAVQAVSHANQVHPVKDYLEALTHDGVIRCDKWLIEFMGAPDTAYVRFVSQAFLVGAIARIMEPGCQVDTALILEGTQGRKKSSAFRALFGEWFTDDMAEIGSKDAKGDVAGVWGIELAELSAIQRGEIETVKAFITRRVDRFRPPYGAHTVERPRQSVFCGTSNGFDYLKDDENRRFLPVRVGAGVANVPGIKAARDQLWAEALALYRQGARWWLEEEEDIDLVSEAKRQQGQRRQADEWENLMGNYLRDAAATLAPVRDATIGDFLKEAIGLPRERWGQADQNRVSRILKGWNWERYRRRRAGILEWRYKAPVSDDETIEPDELGTGNLSGNSKGF